MVIVREAWKSRAALLAACALAVLGLAAAHIGVAHAASSPPATNLGIWNSAEDGGSYSTVSGQSPDVANYYLDWGDPYPPSLRIAGQEHNPGSGQTGVLVGQANLGVSWTGTGPSITPTGNNELYSFYGFDTGTGSAGSTPGYTYELDSNGNVYSYDPASPAQPPAFGDSNVAFGTAVLRETAFN